MGVVRERVEGGAGEGGRREPTTPKLGGPGGLPRSLPWKAAQARTAHLLGPEGANRGPPQASSPMHHCCYYEYYCYYYYCYNHYYYYYYYYYHDCCT